MKPVAVIKHLIHAVVYFITAIILLICGVIIVLYSPWSQEMLREAVVKKFDGQSGVSISLDEFSLHFPIVLEVGGLSVASGADTIVSAERAGIRASVLPLLKGVVELSSTELRGVKYTLGSPDSAMYMVIRADSVGLNKASVRLSDMDMALPDGAIRGGRVDMTLNNSSSPQDTAAAQPTQMRIGLGRLRLDDFGYTMRMLPTIDTLSAVMAHAELRKGSIDMLSQKILLDAFCGHRLDARYIAPDAETAARYAAIPTTENSSEQAQPWTVSIDSIFFDNSHALYTTAGIEPLPGFDVGYIEVSDLDLRLNDFYNQASTVRLPLSLRGKERSGIDLAVDGTLDIDSVALKFNDVRLNTQNGSAVTFQGLLGMGDMVADPTLPLELTLDGDFA
ncbi:MAG: AsmA family protein, partial [Muribaculaceae bacterium]|nr:AsmA family protein [Muribaculaceae bacterium]